MERAPSQLTRLIPPLPPMVVIPVDYMTIPAEEIWEIEPDMTVIDGEVVYTRQR